MRICLFSDTHGNVTALEAVLADMRRQGAFDLTVMLGDLALLGPRPAETVDLIRAQDCLVIVGNTDMMLVNASAQPMTEWTAAQLGARRVAYLAALPFSYTLAPAPGHSLHLFHATPRDLSDDLRPSRSDDDMAARIAPCDAELLAFGHVHIPFVRRLGAQTLFDVASAGFSRDGDRRAAYGIAEWTGAGWTLQHLRVAYDVDQVAAELRGRGIPNGALQAESLLAANY